VIKKIGRTKSRISRRMKKISSGRKTLTLSKILSAQNKSGEASIVDIKKNSPVKSLRRNQFKTPQINWKRNFELAKVILSHKLPIKTSLMASAFVIAFGLFSLSPSLAEQMPKAYPGISGTNQLSSVLSILDINQKQGWADFAMFYKNSFAQIWDIQKNSLAEQSAQPKEFLTYIGKNISQKANSVMLSFSQLKAIQNSLSYKPTKNINYTETEPKKQGEVLAANIQQVEIKSTPVQTVLTVQKISTVALDSQIKEILNQYLAEGKFTGPQGPQGLQGATGENGMVNNYDDNQTSIVGGAPLTTYMPSYGGSLTGLNQTSADTITANWGVINGTLYVAGISTLGVTEILGNLTVTDGTTTLGSLIASDINFSGTLYQNGVPFVSGSGSSTWETLGSDIYFNTGRVGIGTSTPTQTLSVSGNMRLTGALFDTNNASGTAGMILQTTGTGTQWVATSSLAISGSVIGGTSGYVARWTSSSTLSSGVFIDNAVVAGVNATSSTINFLVQGTGANSPFQINSSTGTSLLKVLASGNVGIGTTSPSEKLVIGGGNILLDNNQALMTKTNAGTAFNAVYMDVGNALNIGRSSLISATNNFGLNYWYDMPITKVNMILTNAGNLGIGTSSPIAKLDVYGNLNVATGSTSTLFVNTATGNVGIGITAPTSPLYIQSPSGVQDALSINGYSATNSNSPVIKFSNGGGINILRIGSGASTGESWINSYAGIHFGTGDSSATFQGSEKMTITSGGNVGIGTSTPAAKFNIFGTGELTRLEGGASQTYLSVYNAGTRKGYVGTGGGGVNMILNADNGENILLQGTNIGIGTSTPAAKVNITSTGELIRLEGGASQTYMTFYNGGTRKGYVGTGASGQDIYLVADSGNNISFFNGSSENVRITSSGNVGIGTTTPSRKLSVTDDGIYSAYFTGRVGIGTANPTEQLTLQALSSNNTGISFLNINGTEIGSVRTSVGGNLKLNLDGYSTYGVHLPTGLSIGSSATSVIPPTGGAIISGNVGIGTTAPAQTLSVAGNMRLTGALFDTNNASGTLGMVLQTTGTGTQWVATSTLGIGSSATLSGGTTGKVAIWTSASTISSGVHLDNGTVGGINATSSTASFLVQGTGSLNPFQINSSTGTSLLTVLANGNVGIGTTTPVSKLAFAQAVGAANGINFGDATANLYRSGPGEIKSDGSIYAASNVMAGNSFYFPNSDLLMFATAANGDSGNAYTFANANGGGPSGALRQIKSSSLRISASSTSALLSSLNNDGSAYFSGNVGIGTTTPVINTKLNVANGDTETLTNGVAQLGFSFGSGIGGYTHFIKTAHSNTPALNKMLFAVGNGTVNTSPTSGVVDVLTLTGGGNVGIGTTSPLQTLSVSGNMRLTGALFDTNNASGTLGMLLQSTGTGQRWVATSTLGISGSATPGGSNQQIQFNDNGSFGGSSVFTFDKVNQGVVINGAGSTTPLIVNLTPTQANLSGITINTVSTGGLASGNQIVSFSNNASYSGSGAIAGLTGTYTTLNYNATGGSITHSLATVSRANSNSSGTSVLQAAYYGDLTAYGSGLITTLSLVYDEGHTIGASGNVTNVMGIRVGNTTNSGTLANDYGIYVPARNAAASNNNIGISIGGSPSGPITAGLYVNAENSYLNGKVINNINNDTSSGDFSNLSQFNLIGSATTGTTYGVNSIIESANSSGVIAGVVGGKFSAFQGGSATTTNAIALQANFGDGNSAGYTTNTYGLKVDAVGNGARYGTVYGVYIDNQHPLGGGSVSSAYGIYSSDSASINYFAGNVGINTTTPAQKLSVIGNMRLTGALFDTNNASGTLGMVLKSTGTGQQWVATSTLGFTGGSGTNGYVGRWTSASDLTTGVLLDNGTVAGVNNSTSTVNFLVQGTGSLKAFQVNSSTGTSLLTVLANGNVGIGQTTPTQALDVNGSIQGNSYYVNGTNSYSISNGTDTSGVSNALLFKSSSTNIFTVDSQGQVSIEGTSPFLAVADRSGGYANRMGFYANQNTANLYSVSLSQNIFSVGTGNGHITLGKSSYGYNSNSRTALVTILGEGSSSGTYGLDVQNSGGQTTLMVRDDGNVGLGTTVPGQRLDVVGGTGLPANTGTTQNGSLRIRSATNSVLDFGNSDSSTYAYANWIQSENQADLSLKYPLLLNPSGGNVGIGTTSALQTLSVAGNMRLTGALYDTNNTSGTSGMVLQSTGTGQQWVATSTLGISGGGGSLSGGTNGKVAIWTSASTLSSGTLIDNGTVAGVNATSTGTSFNIQGASGNINPFRVASSTGTAIITVLPNGNVGFNGVTAPDHSIQTSSSLRVDGGIYLGGNSPSGYYNGNLSTSYYYGFNNGGDLTIENKAGDAVSAVNGTGVRIESWNTFLSVKDSGLVGVNTSTAKSTFAIQATSSANTLPLLIVASSSGASLFQVDASGNVGIGTANPSATFEVKGSGTGAVIAKFTDNNTTGCTLAVGGTISCSSDARLKKNISDINYGIDAIMNLHPVQYNWNYETDESVKNLGFIAQEVQGVIPKLVSQDSSGQYQLNTTGIVPILTKAVQQQQLSLNNLQTTITNLQNSGNDLNSSSTTISVQLYLSQDNVGQAKIVAGEQDVRVTFTHPYKYQPIITITSIGSFVPGYVKDVDASGFTIAIDSQDSRHLVNDSLFAWHSFAGEQAKLTVSDGQVLNIDLIPPVAPLETGAVLGQSTPEPQNSPEPTPPAITPTPSPTPTPTPNSSSETGSES
jgi:hypothetical protein